MQTFQVPEPSGIRAQLWSARFGVQSVPKVYASIKAPVGDENTMASPSVWVTLKFVFKYPPSISPPGTSPSPEQRIVTRPPAATFVPAGISNF